MTTATESFLTQLDKAAEGKSINLIEFEGLLDTIAEKPIEEEVVEEENYAIPEYPMQLDKEDDDGDWVVGDPTKPITGFKAGADTAKVIDKANKDVEKDRAVKSLDDNGMKMESAMSELSAMFEDMTGLDLTEPEPEIVAEFIEEEIIEEPVQPVINIDPIALEEATAALKGLFSDVAGVDLLESDRGALVLEVNSSPGLEGIEAASGVNVAGKIIEHCIANQGFSTTDIDQLLRSRPNHGVVSVSIARHPVLNGKQIGDVFTEINEQVVFAIAREGSHIWKPRRTFTLRRGDEIICYGEIDKIHRQLEPWLTHTLNEDNFNPSTMEFSSEFF